MFLPSMAVGPDEQISADRSLPRQDISPDVTVHHPPKVPVTVLDLTAVSSSDDEGADSRRPDYHFAGAPLEGHPIHGLSYQNGCYYTKRGGAAK